MARLGIMRIIAAKKDVSETVVEIPMVKSMHKIVWAQGELCEDNRIFPCSSSLKNDNY